MPNFAVGTRVRDISGTSWTGTVQKDRAIYVNGALVRQAQWQWLPPNAPENYNDSLVSVRWDVPGGKGDQFPFPVYVSDISLEVI